MSNENCSAYTMGSPKVPHSFDGGITGAIMVSRVSERLAVSWRLMLNSPTLLPIRMIVSVMDPFGWKRAGLSRLTFGSPQKNQTGYGKVQYYWVDRHEHPYRYRALRAQQLEVDVHDSTRGRSWRCRD